MFNKFMWHKIKKKTDLLETETSWGIGVLGVMGQVYEPP